MKKVNGFDTILSSLVFLGMSFALYMAFIYAPTERTMGEVQRIFYFHVSSAWLAFLAFFLVFIFSILYLITHQRKFDMLAVANAEVGVVFCTIVLVTGPLWAKPVWGIYWTWDARLTSSLILWLIYISYLMMRAYIADENKRGNLAAIVGIIGFLDVPIVYMSIRWWRTQHPSPVIMGGEDSGLAPDMRTAFFVCLIAFTLLFLYLTRKRYQLEKLESDVDQLYKLAQR
ncbi:MAG: cytochrome C assembly protein [Gemmatimonadetes bacterium]|nr:MAG: cytochrome C assembly protein [Gemmatimonadota bacterium]